MKRLADDKYAIFISTIGSGELELPLARFTGPIYLIIFRDPKDFSMEVPGHDFELDCAAAVIHPSWMTRCGCA